MVNGCMVRGGIPLRIIKCGLFDFQAGFCAFAQLQQNQTDGTAFPVAQQKQPFGFQFSGGTHGDDFPQPFRFVNQIQVSSEFQSPSCGSDEIRQAALQLLPCLGQGLADAAGRKTGRHRGTEKDH